MKGPLFPSAELFVTIEMKREAQNCTFPLCVATKGMWLQVAAVLKSAGPFSAGGGYSKALAYWLGTRRHILTPCSARVSHQDFLPFHWRSWVCFCFFSPSHFLHFKAGVLFSFAKGKNLNPPLLLFFFFFQKATFFRAWSETVRRSCSRRFLNCFIVLQRWMPKPR